MKKLRCFATIGDDIKYEFDLMPNSYQEIGSEQVGRNFQQGEQGAVSVEGSFFPVKINVMGSHE